MNEVKELTLEAIGVSELNPRKTTNAAQMKELVESVKARGILQPIIVRRVHAGTAHPCGFEIVCGHRRHTAAIAAGLKVIPCIVKDLTDAEAQEISIIENLQREDVNAMDEAAGIQELLKANEHDIRSVASKLGKSEAYIQGRMRLLKLPANVQKAISTGEISPAHGLVIGRLTDPGDQKKLLKDISEDKLSVRAAENLLNNYGKRLKDAPFDTAECSGCPQNGTKIKDFFDKDTNLKGRCMDPGCYSRKTKEWIEMVRADIKKHGGVLLTEAAAEAKFGGVRYGSNTTIGAAEKKQLGKKYKEKCEKCEKHCFVLLKARYDSDQDDIAEVCFNSRCFHGTAGSAVSSKEQTEMNKNRAETKIENRCFRVMDATWRKFVIAFSDEHVVNVMACKQVWEAVMGWEAEAGKTEIKKLWLKTDAELRELILKGFQSLLKDQYEHADVADLAAGLNFDPAKDLKLDDLYWSACSKAELMKLAKQLGAKDLQESDKRDAMIKKVKADYKAGFVPADIQKYMKDPS